MKIRPLLVSLFTLCLCLARPLRAEEAKAPGYKVILDITMDEAGVAESAQIVESDDFSGDQVLNQIAVSLAKGIKMPPKQKDGKPVKYVVRAPFDFPVEGDEGAAANLAPKPSLSGSTVVQPVYPAALLAKEEVGGAILELIINPDGYVKTATILRASHPEFGAAALAAVKQWLFKPAMKDGVPFESRWRLAIAFASDEKDVDWKWRIAPRPSLGGFKVIHPKNPPPVAPAAAPASVTPPVPAK